MKAEKSKACRIYLNSWQQRMFRDLASREVKKRFDVKVPKLLELRIGPIKCLASYKLPPEGIRKDDWVLYLDDAQTVQVQQEFGLRTRVTEINVSMQEIKAGNLRFM